MFYFGLMMAALQPKHVALKFNYKILSNCWLLYFVFLDGNKYHYITIFQLVKKFSAFYGTRRFITAVASACHLSLSSVSSIQSISLNPTSCRCILILSSHLSLGLPSCFFLQFSPPETCIRLSSPHTRYMPRPSHSWFYHSKSTGCGVQIIKFLII